MLGAGFFQEYTGLKKSKQKIYDQSAFVTEELEPDTGDALVTQEEDHEDEFLDGLLQEGDEDAILITEYEAAINDTIQGDAELATALNVYTDARRRLSERFRNRGFWPTRPSKSSGKGKGFKSKRDFSGKGRKSLQDRILSSRCRICNKVGHWKAECPERKSAASGSVPTANVSLAEVAQPSSSHNDALLLEFMTLPEIDAEKPIDVPLFDTPEVSFLTLSEALKGITNRVNGVIYSPRGNQFRNDRQAIVTLPNHCDPPSNSDDFSGETAKSADVHFASHGSFGVVDLGASKTVIGSKHIPDLLKSFDPSIREKLRRCPCQMQFRFGNQGVLCSEQALLVPVGQLVVKIAIVPGNTPFLISNSFLRGMQAIVDTHKARLISPLLNQSIELHLSPRGLFLMDLNQVIRAAKLSKSSLKPETVCTTITIEEKDPVRVWNQPQEVNSGVCKISTTVKSRNDPHKPDRVGFQHVDSATNHKEFNGQPGALQTISKSDPVAASQVVSRHVRFDSPPQADPEASAGGTSRHLALQAGGPDGHEDTFGSTHVGKSFEHMWNHEQSWITWFTPRYVKSSKLEHRLVIRFVEMEVALHESQGTTMPVLPSLKDTMTLMPKTSENDLPGGYPKAKAKTSMAKASTNTVPPGRPSMTEHAEEFEFLMDEWSLQRDDWPDQAEPSVNQADVQALQSRMLNLENALQQVITHLQGLTPSSKAEEA